MFIGLFAVSLVLALTISALIAGIAKHVVESILHRFLADRIAAAVSTYFRYAIFVVGISDGTRSRLLFDYISFSPWERAKLVAEVTPEFWALELYRTTVQTLEGILGLVFVFSFVTFVAIVLIRKANLKDLQPTQE
jgi:hypothetical protein